MFGRYRSSDSACPCWRLRGGVAVHARDEKVAVCGTVPVARRGLACRRPARAVRTANTGFKAVPEGRSRHRLGRHSHAPARLASYAGRLARKATQSLGRYEQARSQPNPRTSARAAAPLSNPTLRQHGNRPSTSGPRSSQPLSSMIRWH